MTGYFIAGDEVAAFKSARSFAYRVATERVVMKVERTQLRCAHKRCVAGKPEITTGLEDSFPCRHGILNKRKKKSRASWRQACLNTLDYVKQCDSAEVQAEKPAWAECRVAAWAKKTLPCTCR